MNHKLYKCYEHKDVAWLVREKKWAQAIIRSYTKRLNDDILTEQRRERIIDNIEFEMRYIQTVDEYLIRLHEALECKND